MVTPKADKLNKLSTETKRINTIINNFEAIGWNNLKSKDKTVLDKAREEKKKIEQNGKELQLDPAQYYATVEESGLYDFSFQLPFCREENFPSLPNAPVMTIGGKSYEIPHETLFGTRYKIKTDQNCFTMIGNINLEKGEVKIAASYIFNLANLIFSKVNPGKQIEPPVTEFKKIDPTKYVLMVHGARDNFPLVFSESFNKGWKAYPVNFQTSAALETKNYKIISGNEADQASREELADYIKRGWVTDVSKNDFVSKNFQGTIQNDNLSNGLIWDTWFKTSLPEETHQLVNGYANSWLIDPLKICNQGIKCRQNPDGTVDFELIVEFWPQRLYYIGLAISLLTLLGSLVIILVSRFRK